ncbi:MAG: hypothetical protein Q9207_006323 [Kuettlingeria erythrocarpa]
MADAISIEEANKIRAAIGLKPLPVPGGAGGPASKDGDDESSSEEEQASTLESRQAQGYDNWKQLQDEQDAKAKREAKNEAIKKARDAARKFSKLEGKGLGEADEATELDTKTWLLQQKKRQRKLERERLRKLEKELEERDQAPEHTAEDLAGVKVAHELGDFEAGEQILTLKDAGIDENEEEGDELENQELKEREALQDRLNLKRKKPVYDPHETDEAEGATILKHYDETIEGKKRKRFTLDGQGSTAEEREAMRHSVGQKLKSQLISLDIAKVIPTSDYKDEEAKIKKPKKRKTKSTRQKPVDDDELFPTEASNDSTADDHRMDVDQAHPGLGVAPSKPTQDFTSFADDEDLQATLAIQRREALKKRKRTRPEDVARQLREESEEARNKMEEDGQADEGGLVIDETTEFVANLRNSPEPQKARAEAATSHATVKRELPTAEDEHDVDMDRAYNDTPDPEGRFKRETSTPAASELTGTGLEDEANINQGVGATLALLSQRGLIKNAQDGDINALHRERQRFLVEKRNREAEAERKARAQRERDRASGKLDRMSARDREEHARWENKQRDQAESRQMAEIFNREYRPDVQLKYVDEFGRSMNQKEAFKHLSHQFHGKGSGKQKTEKFLKKIDDDKRREAMSSLDASQATGMNNAMGATAKKNRQAGVRLA